MNKTTKYSVTDIVNACYMTGLFGLFFISWSNSSIYGVIGEMMPLILLAGNGLMFLFILPNMFTSRQPELLMVFVIIMFIVISAIFANSGIGGILVLVNVLLMLVIFPYIKLKEEQLYILSFFMLLFFFYYIVNTPTGFNPNSLGYIFYITTVYATFLLSRRKAYKVLAIVLALFACYVTMLTGSRSALLALLLFIGLVYFVPAKIWGNKVMVKLISVLLTIGSLLFVLLYVYMWQNDITIDLSSLTNKSFFSGREKIWSELLNNFKHHAVMGLGSNYHIQAEQTLNVHNSLFNILVIYGTPVFLFIVILILNRIWALSQAIMTNANTKIAVAGFFGVLLVGFFETNLLWSAYVFPSLFLIAIAYSGSDWSRGNAERSGKVESEYFVANARKEG